MTTELEIEYKNLLKASEYDHLTHLFKDNLTRCINQTNVYFDTHTQDLKLKKAGLRLRLLKDKTELTLKWPTENEDAYLEYTDVLPSMDPEITPTLTLSFPKDSLVEKKLKEEHIPIDQLMNIGALTTYRQEYQLRDDILMVLDESHYFGKTDYELEMEVADASIGKEYFDTFLTTHRLKRVPTAKKIARMMAQKNN